MKNNNDEQYFLWMLSQSLISNIQVYFAWGWHSSLEGSFLFGKQYHTNTSKFSICTITLLCHFCDQKSSPQKVHCLDLSLNRRKHLANSVRVSPCFLKSSNFLTHLPDTHCEAKDTESPYTPSQVLSGILLVYV